MSDFDALTNIFAQPSSTTVKHAGKFQPKRCARKVESAKQDSVVTLESNSSGIQDSSFLGSVEFSYADERREPETDDNCEFGFDGSNPEQNFETVSGPDVVEGVESPDVDGVEGWRPEEVPVSEVGEDGGSGGSHMKLRKRVRWQEPRDDEENGNDDLNVESGMNEERSDGDCRVEASAEKERDVSGMNEDQSDGECRVEEGSTKKKRNQKGAKRTKSGTTKTTKGKGADSEAPEEVPKKKKFPHATKRKRRQVDKALLETPEYDINFKQIAIKDLILLGEAKERISSKEAATKKNQTSERSGNEEENDEDDDEEYHVVETTRYFNYGSYSGRSKSTRWSKSETELLYQAIRQFGTDFAMIQQLFPHRTRHQIKLKFKNEERKNPMLVHDALGDRSNDLSQLKQLIEKLQANKEQTTKEDENDDDPSTEMFEDEVGQDELVQHEEEREEIRKDDDDNDNNFGGEVKSPEHSEAVEYEAESPIDFEAYQSAWD